MLIVFESIKRQKPGFFLYFTHKFPKNSINFNFYNVKLVPFKFNHLKFIFKIFRFYYYLSINRIVNFADCNKEEYFSISNEGVCHYNVQEEIEFTELARWKHEYIIYSKLKKLSVFANFRRWKAFNVWHCNVRDKRIRSARRNLEKNLFFLNQVNFYLKILINSFTPIIKYKINYM
jgi:hypothetical protein